MTCVRVVSAIALVCAELRQSMAIIHYYIQQKIVPLYHVTSYSFSKFEVVVALSLLKAVDITAQHLQLSIVIKIYTQ